jgi:hypothetical protein
MKTAAGFRGRRLKGRKPRHANPRASQSVDREVPAGDRCEARGEPVDVVEDREAVGHPDEPHDRQQRREQVVLDQLHADAAREHDPGGGELGADLDQRRERAAVVDRADDEHHGAPAEDPGELPARLEGADGERGAHTGDEAGEDADPADRGHVALVPAVASRSGDHAPRHGRAQKEPDDERGDRQRGEDGDCAHRRAKGNEVLLATCVRVS